MTTTLRLPRKPAAPAPQRQVHRTWRWILIVAVGAVAGVLALMAAVRRLFPESTPEDA